MYEQQRRRDRVPSSHVEQDLSVDCPDMDDERATLKMQKEQRKHRERKNREHDDRESELDNKDANGHRVFEKRKSSKKVEGTGMNSTSPYTNDKDALKGWLIIK